ncbi:glycosyltransferase [Halopseudomonas pachastrellae]|uniref:Glycosyltransferase n=1 Tax=Halopseudomonas pachastrellae TaxID=254161 RepID=A0A1S8DI36_9GAMM|nr:WecB/TagA/CpsF family glycosyltransferase [Halopseudomonas pachastrellae]ONM44057.1 glycosyltransferase [Halopseudomonas pachastrellae]SFM80072.1 N-acetylglucosaminyldiphosphoundecaprenol N-acetyl-beta-D-mannosaminyltransferase [Halopseudomonas pachastrellae]
MPSILGLNYDKLSRDQTITKICTHIDNGDKIIRADINVGTITSSQSDKKLLDFINSCDIVNMDGAGALMGAAFLGLPRPERVTGVDLFLELLKVSEKNSYPVYFLGATKDTLDLLVKKVKSKFPALDICGYHDGYFWGAEKKVIEDINNSQPKILFIGIKSPEKEYFQTDYKNAISANLIMGVGGSFDVVSGKIKRAPALIQKLGLEWLYRIYQEPRRLLKRYLKSNYQFALLLAKEKTNQLTKGGKND